MPLFCKQCSGRRLPKTVMPENRTLWLCENCKNFVDLEDFIVREAKEENTTHPKRIIKNGLNQFHLLKVLKIHFDTRRN